MAGAVWVLWAPGPAARLPALLDRRGPRQNSAPGVGGLLRRVWGWAFGALELHESPGEQLAFDLELVAICLRAGLPVERSLELAGAANSDRSGLGRLGRSLELGSVEDTPQRLEEVASLIEFSRSTGVALAPLLLGMAADTRRAERRRRQMAAAKLGVHLVIPLGVCVLPAVILMGVVPVVITLVGDMAGIFMR